MFNLSLIVLTCVHFFYLKSIYKKYQNKKSIQAFLDIQYHILYIVVAKLFMIMPYIDYETEQDKLSMHVHTTITCSFRTNTTVPNNIIALGVASYTIKLISIHVINNT